MTLRPWSGADDRHVKTSRLPRRARLDRHDELTVTGTVLLTFSVIDHQEFTYKPGQFVAIDMDHPDLGYRRSPYCLYGASTSRRAFELLVRVVPEGPVSLVLAGLEEGDVIGFRGPTGHSMLPKELDSQLVMIATGVGLGPCRCLLRILADTEPWRRVTLYWGLRLEDDVCLLDELMLLERSLDQFDWHITLSSPNREWPPLRGRVTETVPPLLETVGDKHFYLVGNGAMIAEMSQALREIGVPGYRIYEESFFNHRHRPTDGEVRSIVERFVATDLMTPITHLGSMYEQRR